MFVNQMSQVRVCIEHSRYTEPSRPKDTTVAPSTTFNKPATTVSCPMPISGSTIRARMCQPVHKEHYPSLPAVVNSFHLFAKGLPMHWTSHFALLRLACFNVCQTPVPKLWPRWHQLYSFSPYHFQPPYGSKTADLQQIGCCIWRAD